MYKNGKEKCVCVYVFGVRVFLFIFDGSFQNWLLMIIQRLFCHLKRNGTQNYEIIFFFEI